MRLEPLGIRGFRAWGLGPRSVPGTLRKTRVGIGTLGNRVAEGGWITAQIEGLGSALPGLTLR